MKKYCLSCGHANEYSGTTPEKCDKCKKSFIEVAKDTITLSPPSRAVMDNSPPQNEDLIENEYESSGEIEEPEPMSEEEISKIFLAEASRGINLRDLIKQEKAKEKTIPLAKKSKTTRDSSKRK